MWSAVLENEARDKAVVYGNLVLHVCGRRSRARTGRVHGCSVGRSPVLSAHLHRRTVRDRDPPAAVGRRHPASTSDLAFKVSQLLRTMTML